MPANTTPVYILSGTLGSVLVTAANTSNQGGGTIGTDIFKVTNTGTNGTFITKIRWIPTATTPTTTTGTVGRVYFSTVQSGSTTSSNTYMIAELTLPALGADNASAAAPYYDIPINQLLPASGAVLVTNHASPAANTAWRATAFGGDL